VVRSGRVVAEADRGRAADEGRAGVADALGDLPGIGRVDLEVLGRERLGDGDRVVDVVDQRDGALTGERGLDPLTVTGRGHLGVERGLDRVDQREVVGDQQRGRELVVLGLGDEVGGDHLRVRGGVGDDRDLGRAGVAVGADAALRGELLLRERDVEVARPDHEVADRHAGGAVGHRRDRLGAADAHHPVDAEQRAAARIVRFGHPSGSPPRASPSAANPVPVGGVHSTISSTPATWAGTTVMTTVDG
jgi:hypothetical protein